MEYEFDQYPEDSIIYQKPIMEIPENNPFSIMFYEGQRGTMRMGDGFIDVEVVKKAILDIPRVNLMKNLDQEITPMEIMGMMALRGMLWANGGKGT